MVMGRAISTKEATEKGVITGLFKTDEERQQLVKTFAKEFASRCGPELGFEKARLHSDTVEWCETTSFGSFDLQRIA